MSYPQWNAFAAAIYKTRSYENGFGLALALFDSQRQFELSFSERENERHYRQIGELCLECLYRANRWSDYLDFVEQMRQRCPQYFSIYAPKDEVFQIHGERIKPFILGDVGDGIRVHFSYGISYHVDEARKKLHAFRTGKPIRHVLYHSQSELSPAEIQRRIRQIRSMFS